MQFGLFMMPLHPWREPAGPAQSGGAGASPLLAITQDSDDSTWDHRSLQLLMEEVGPRLADLP